MYGCSAYHLDDSQPQINVTKLRQSNASCAVTPFAWEPEEKSDSGNMRPADLEKWDQIYFDSVNLSDICAETVKVVPGGKVPNGIDYVIDGKISDFYFKKNWVPMFFPVHLGISLFTLTVYTWAAGPTTTTKVELKYTVRVKNIKTNSVIAEIPEHYSSTDVMTMYSRDTDHPYGNPGMVLAQVFNDANAKIAEAIRSDLARHANP
jgi:hypothetical protein